MTAVGIRILRLDEQGCTSRFDDEARRILFGISVRRLGDGDITACSLCGRAVSHTYHTLCGRCFLESEGGR